MSSDLTWIPRAAQRRVRWQNGLGWTTEIAARPAGTFAWRLSVAEVDADSEFSRFPGVDRTILALTGPGFTLFVDGAPPVVLRPGGPAHAFPGDLPARCEVPAPGRDFNIMTRRGAFTHALAQVDLHRHRSVPRPADATVAIYVVTGHAALGDPLAPGDCVLVEPAPEARSPLTLTGDAAVLLVELRPVRVLVEP